MRIRTRLSLAMSALVAGTGAVVIAAIYFATAAGIEREGRNAVRGELDQLVRAWQSEGMEGLVEEVERRSESAGAHPFAYLVTDERRVRITGNVREWPDSYGGEGPADEIPVEWRRADLWSQRRVQVEAARLDRHHLLVGRDENSDAGLLESLQYSALGALLLASFLAVAAGLVVSRGLLGRVESMRGKIDGILAGASKERVTVGPSGDEFDQLAARFNRLLDENDRLLEQVREATNNIAHDLRTPLSRMHARLEAALANPDARDPRETLEALSSDTDRLLETFNGLLQIARVEAQALREALQPIAIAPLIEDVVDLYGPLAEEAGVRLRADVEAELSVAAERQLLGQALTNLVDNALKYAADGGSIAIEAARSAGRVEISVSDRGPGIPEADRERVVGRLVRLDRSRGIPGTGLGLSFALAVAELHGGELRLEDHQPGLRVVLLLPEATPSVGASAPTSQPTEGEGRR